MLYISLCTLVQDMGKSVLVGNINIWVHRMENIMQWQQQLDNIQINRVNDPTETFGMLTNNKQKQKKNILMRLIIYCSKYCIKILTQLMMGGRWQQRGRKFKCVRTKSRRIECPINY